MSQFNPPAWVAVGWSPDGALLAAYTRTGEIRVWDAATGKLLKTLTEERPGVCPRLTWLPDSRRVLIPTDGEHNDNRGVRLWDLVEGKPIGDVLAHGRNWGRVFGQCLSAGAQKLALQSHVFASTPIWLFDLPSGTLTRETPLHAWAGSANWSPDSRELAVTQDDTAVWSNGAHRGLATLPTADRGRAVWSAQPGRIVVSNYGDLVTVYHRQRGGWNAQHLPEIRGFGSHRAPAALSPNGRLLARSGPPDTASEGKCPVEIWDIRLPQRLVRTEPLAQIIRALAWTPDGALLAASTVNGGAAVYDAATGKRAGQLPADQSEMLPLAFSPDGKTLAAGYCGFGKGFVRLFDVRNHPLPLPPGEETRSAAPATLELLHHLGCDGSGSAPEILALHWSADGRALQVFGSTAAYVFDAATGEPLAEAPRPEIDHGYLRPANFSPDGRYLAVATTCTRVWDLAELNAAASATNAVRGATPKAGRNDKETRGQGDKESTDAMLNLKSEIQTPKLRLVASVVPLGDQQWAVVSAEGHWLGTPEAEQRLVYVIQTAAGQETLSPGEFYQRFNWKNDPSKVVLPE